MNGKLFIESEVQYRQFEFILTLYRYMTVSYTHLMSGKDVWLTIAAVAVFVLMGLSNLLWK